MLSVRNEDFYISYNDTDEWQFANNLGELLIFKNGGAQCITTMVKPFILQLVLK